MRDLHETLDDLELPPRFIEREPRRDSHTSWLAPEYSSLFLHKRERLESGDSLFMLQTNIARRDAAKCFTQVCVGERSERRRMSFSLMPEFSFETSENKPGVEEESVIDQKLTIERTQAARVSYAETETGGTDKEESPRTEARFLIKVKRAEAGLEVSGADASELFDSCPDEFSGVVEEKAGGLIFGDEPSRLLAKTGRVVQYWAQTSLLIPNVFRHLRPFDDEPEYLLELQDYSRKELLVQSNGLKFKPAKDRSGKKTKRGGK